MPVGSMERRGSIGSRRRAEACAPRPCNACPDVARIVARACLDGPHELLTRAAPSHARLDAIVAPIGAALKRAGVGDATRLVRLRTAPQEGIGLPPDADDQVAALLELLDRLIG